MASWHEPVNVRIRFLNWWVYPPRNEDYVPGDTALVSQRLADILVRNGTVEIIAQGEA